MKRTDCKACKRWVVKVGSALLSEGGDALNLQFIESLARQIAELRSHQIEVLLVSSGSIAAGMSLLGFAKRPSKISEQQAAAALGQAKLIRYYEEAFTPHSIAIAQILLTHADIANRQRYLNARNTLRKLIEFSVIPIINENDTVASEEIRFGDNDQLAALVANCVDADLLVLLTDQDGMFSSNPRVDAKAKMLDLARADDVNLDAMVDDGGDLGRGGMITKLQAARIAARNGSDTIIANGRMHEILPRLFAGEALGTCLSAEKRINSRKQWMAGQIQIAGKLTLDRGATDAILKKGKSLLPVGVVHVSGEFERGALVRCLDPDGNEIARGLCNYGSKECVKISGQPSTEIAALLAYHGDDELIHRSNLVLTQIGDKQIGES